MLVYFVNLFLVVSAAFLARKSESRVVSRSLHGVALASMVLVGGLRDRTIGTDTFYYAMDFEHIRTLADVALIGSKQGEYGFWVLTWVVHIISDQYLVYLLAIALIVICCYHRVIVVHSDDVVVSFFVFITLGTYSFFFNASRQGIACAIYAIAIGAMLERKPSKYIAYVLVAYLFHKTAIMMLPVYLIFSRPNTLKNNLVIILTGCAVAVFSSFAMEVASGVETRYSGYLARAEGGGYYMVGISVLFALFFLIFKKSVLVDRARYERFLNMILFGLMIGVVSSALSLDPSGFLRYGAYFGIAGVLIWPIVFKNLPDPRERLAVGYLFVVYCLVFFAMTTERFSDLVPFKFNPSLQVLR